MRGPTTPCTIELSQPIQKSSFADLGVLAVLDELAQVCQPVVLAWPGFGIFLDGGDDGVNDGGFVVETDFIWDHPGEEVHDDAVLLGKLDVKTADSHGGGVKPTIYFFF